MTTVFADTFYFIALVSPDDEAHAQAVDYARLVDRIVTTEWVLTEFADGLATTPNRHLLGEIRSALLADDSAHIVVWETGLYQRGIDLYLNRPDKTWSLTDCLTFIVMQDHNLADALTGDHHFEQAGFRILLGQK